MKKILFYSAALLLVLAVVSCSTVSGTSKPEQYVHLSVSNNRESEDVILSGEEVVFTLDSQLPENVSADSITWYLNSEKYADGVYSITVKTDEEVNLRYSAHVEIDSDGYKAKSNYSRVIAVADMKYKDYALAIYDFINQLQEKYEIEDIPGISISMYGRDGEIDFDLFEGYSSLDRRIKNSEEEGHVLGSISKYITAATIFKLIEEEGSTISLDQPIRTWISEDDIDPQHTGEALKKINLDEPISALISHTAGIGDYMGIPIALDMLTAENGNLLYDIAGLVLNKKKPEYPFKDGWAPYKVFPYILTDYNPEGERSYSSPGYMLLGMVIQKYLDEKHPGMTINEYANENFFEPLCNSDVMLAPSDITDYSKYDEVADQHVFDEKMAAIIKGYADIDIRLMKLLGLNPEGKKLYSFNDFFKNSNRYFCETCWTAGAFIANSHQIARLNYYTLSEKTSDELLADVRKYMTRGLETDDFVNLEYGVMNYKHKDANGDIKEIYYGHGGKSVAQSNETLYHPGKDVSYTIFLDSNLQESDFMPLIYKLCELTPELN